MVDSDRELANARAILERRRMDYSDAEALLQRVSPEGRRLAKAARQRKYRQGLVVTRRLFAAVAVVVAAVLAWGLVIGPIGMMGFLAAVVTLVIAWTVIIAASRQPEETPQRLVQSDLPQLPSRTEAWLQAQRPALPAPAAKLVDGIGVRLETLAPQLATIDPREPIAQEVRKLIAEELPDLIQGYNRVPASLRKVEKDGPSPDRQLAEGLTVVEGELARMSADLASGDLSKFAAQQRYLELKYKDDGAI
ncbi:hypothetical protein FHS31_002698 [Sphingomonas vulcanisoli]|uniref:DUF2207 domain-containing protein n=1 Tax=Sphingomonas vulcanisoli TaxID=1658060 RepID=A0ABX0TUD5_9SPHN|nr:hypothetical protein [Sphingomonas vulcanisoli]NIJ09066.1 hypothetical protein [Sphingomonas vulcanisoli]